MCCGILREDEGARSQTNTCTPGLEDQKSVLAGRAISMTYPDPGLTVLIRDWFALCFTLCSSQYFALITYFLVVITHDFAIRIMSMPLDCKLWEGRDSVLFA